MRYAIRVMSHLVTGEVTLYTFFQVANINR